MLLLLFTSSPVMYVCLCLSVCGWVCACQHNTLQARGARSPGEGRGVTSVLRIELSSSRARS